jgi:hypothetical protein
MFKNFLRSSASGNSQYNNNNDHHNADDQDFIIYTAFQHEERVECEYTNRELKNKELNDRRFSQ